MYKRVTEMHNRKKKLNLNKIRKWKTDRSPLWKESRDVCEEERVGEGVKEEDGEAHVHHVYFICECARVPIPIPSDKAVAAAGSHPCL